MIFIATGTQNKQFERIFKIVDNAIEKGYVKEEVIAQTGFTNYNSKNIKCIKFMSDKKLNEYMKDADLVLAHGGIGTITSALSHKRKVFAMARLSMYNEHVNDHQLQIVDKFAALGYIKKITDFDDFVREYKNLKKFKPIFPKYDNSKMLDIIEKFIG